MTEKKIMTDKQKQARLKNLEIGRQKRAESIKQKKQAQEEEYDLSSEDEKSSSGSESEDYVISKVSAKKQTGKTSVLKNKKLVKEDKPNKSNKEIEELRNMVIELATMQKKQRKQKSAPRSSGGTKIVVLPNNNTSQPKSTNTATIDALLRALG